MNKPLHIVCLDAPSPPDYGGAIDMYYTIKAVAEHGAAITLHYFDYKPGRNAADLEAYCTQFFAYRRKSFLQAPTFSKPHIVTSRINKKLIAQLNKDDHPVLLEGIHCTGILPYLKNKNRKIVVRLHNDEAMYYQQLAKSETNFFKQSYYKLESRLLQRYQQNLSPHVSYAALSQQDVAIFQQAYQLSDVLYVPPFLPWQQVTSLPGTGTYCLYHGNLSVAENEAAALWLLEHVISKTNLRFIIAGKKPLHKLKQAAAVPQVQLISDPTEDELNQLIQHAQVHVLPDLNATGIKLKWLHALFQGRFCITTQHELQNSRTVAAAKTTADFVQALLLFAKQPFTETDIAERKKLLLPFNNQNGAQQLSERLW